VNGRYADRLHPYGENFGFMSGRSAILFVEPETTADVE